MRNDEIKYKTNKYLTVCFCNTNDRIFLLLSTAFVKSKARQRARRKVSNMITLLSVWRLDRTKQNKTQAYNKPQPNMYEFCVVRIVITLVKRIYLAARRR